MRTVHFPIRAILFTHLFGYKSSDIKVTTKCRCEPMSQKAVRRRLAAFDFDYTIVAQNTDTVVRDMLPPNKFPSDSIISESGWTNYMAAVFKELHDLHFTPAQICEKIRCIPEVPGFVRLLKRLHLQHDFDMIIISDSNSIFIAEWLQAHKLADCFAGIFTNPAHFEKNALLAIRPHHHQTDCSLSAPNLCKGKVLEHFVVEQDLRHNIAYENIIYVGDGNNDICPVLKLRRSDVACARRGFALDKKIEKNRDKMSLRAEVIVWKSGFELLEELEKRFERGNNEN